MSARPSPQKLRRQKRAPRTTPAVIVRKSADEQAAEQDRERAEVIATLRTQMALLAGLDEAFAIQQSEQSDQQYAQRVAIRETQDALSTLTRLTPDVLTRMPDLAGSLREVARLADERMHAAGLSRLDVVREAPTHSTPVASGASAGWAGMGLNSVRHDALGVANADYLRRLATKNPWVQAAVTTRKQQIGRADIAVTPDDPLAPFDSSIQEAVEDVLDFPNELKDSYRSLMEPVIDDVLTLDRGCISKDLDARGIPHHLYVEDGSTIRIFADWNGQPDQPHYLFVPPGSAPGLAGNAQGIPLFNDQLICVIANAASYRFGLAPTQVLLDTIRGDLAATEKAMALVRDVPPPHLVNVKTAGGSGVAQRTLDGIRTEYERRVAGQREIMFMGADDLKVFPLMFSLKDNQFLEWQIYLARKICACFQISPQQIGITFDINKATAETQQELFEDSGLLPLMLLLEEFLNRELLADFAPKRKVDGRPDMRRLNLRIFYPEVSELARMRHAERVIKTITGSLGGLPLLTPNQAMEMLGREPVKGGNRFWVLNNTLGVIPTPLGYDDDYGDWGSMPTAGDLGAQDPEGGIDEEAHEPADVSGDQGEATNTGAGGTTVGNDTTGSGDQPNLQDADSNPVSQGSSQQQQGNASGNGGNAGKRVGRSVARPTPVAVPDAAPVPAWLLRACDARKPGTPWSPATESLTRQRAAAVSRARGYPRRYDGGFSLNPDEQPPLPLVVRVVEGEIVKSESDDDEPTKKPKPLGRVPRSVADSYHVPHGQVQAAQELSAKTWALFEGAQKRGQRAHGEESA